MADRATTEDGRLRGIFPVLQIPFGLDGDIVERDVRREVDFCVAGGVNGLVVPALASEFMVLTDEERRSVVEIVVDQTRGRVPVVVGVAAPSAQAAIAFARHARRAGAQAVMALPPYVRRPSIDGVVAYYAAIAAASDLPVVIQNASPPFGMNLPTSAIERMFREIEQVQYVKEERQPAGHHMSALLDAPPPGLAGVFGGTAGLHLPSELARGAIGCMPSAAVADVLARVQRLAVAGRHADARALHHRLLPLLMLEMSVLMSVSKQVLRRRGVFEQTGMRDPEFPPLDEGDIVELDALWPALSALFEEGGATREPLRQT